MSFHRAKGRFLTSLHDLRQTRTLAACAMLLAMEVVLNLYVSVPIGQTIRISFGYLCVAAAGALFGPVPAIACGALGDIIGHVLKPLGAYFPGFTLSAMIGGAVYAVTFYQKPVTIVRVVIAQAVVDIGVNLLLNTLWLQMQGGKAFTVLLPARAVKNLLQYPVDVVLLFLWLRWLSANRARLRI